MKKQITMAAVLTMLFGGFLQSAFALPDTALVNRVRDAIYEVSPDQWSDNQIKAALNLEIVSKSRKYLLLPDTISFNTASGTDEYALPVNFVAPYLIFHKIGARTEPLIPMGEDLKQKPQGAPAAQYLLFNRRIRLVTAPTDIHRVIVWYFKEGAAMGFTGAECPLDDPDEPILIYGAAEKLLKFLKDPLMRATAAEYQATAQAEGETARIAHLIWAINQSSYLIGERPLGENKAAK